VRRFTRTLLVGLATLATVSTLSVNAAQASTWDQIYNWNSNKCVGIDSGLAGIWNCTNNPDQTWHWGDDYLGVYAYRQLVNGNGKCLGVQGGSTAAGARVVAWTCNGNPDQYWLYNSFYNTVTNNNSGMILGVSGGSTANSAAVVQWYNNGHPDQSWNISF
jgi:hypothetical protein